MKKILFIFSIILLFIFGNYLILEKNAVCAIIDFETVPIGPGPSDGLPINTQYQALIDGGVTFSTTAGDPRLEAVGGPVAGDLLPGFIYDQTSSHDKEAAGIGLDNYFLRLGIDDLINGVPPTLTIDYTTPVSAASAQIWDIDSPTPDPMTGPTDYERWEVTAFQKTGLNTYTILESVESDPGLWIGLDPLQNPDMLDGKPWTWSFDRGANNFEIDRIEIAWTGTKPMGIGLAFDNFNTTAVPIPGAIWLFGSGILGMVFMRRKLKN